MRGVDHEHLGRTAVRFQLQTQLVAECRRQRKALDWRGGLNAIRRRDDDAVWRKGQVDRFDRY